MSATVAQPFPSPPLPHSAGPSASCHASCAPARAKRDERLLSADDLAERWQVPKAHVYRLTREGLLPTVKLGRYCRYLVAAVEEWEQHGGTAANG
jgi:excisionase family DNA binding protein